MLVIKNFHYQERFKFTMNNLISVIIPTYNRAHIIAETINTVLEQTYKNFEIIIVDDGQQIIQVKS